MPVVGHRNVNEPTRRRVRVTSVVPERGYAECVDGTGGTINVSVESSVGPVNFLPAEGQEWYIERVAGVWHFERRTLYQNEGIARLREGESGDVIIEAEGKLQMFDRDGKYPDLAKVEELIRDYDKSIDVDKTRLAAPVITKVTDALTVDDLGNPACNVTITFSAPLETRTVELWLSYDQTAWTLNGHTTASPGTIKGVPPGTTIWVKVRAAAASGFMSEMSDPFTFKTRGFADAAPVPSLPKATSGAGLIEVVWDGKDSTGAAMPKNVAGVNVSIQDTQERTAITGSASASAPFMYPNVVGGTAYWVRLQSRTFRGTVSAWTAPVSVVAVTSVDVKKLRDDLNARIGDVADMLELDREALTGLQTTAGRLQHIADIAALEYERALAELEADPDNAELAARVEELRVAAEDARRAALISQTLASQTSPTVDLPMEVTLAKDEPFTLDRSRYRRGDLWIDTDSVAPAYEWDDGIWASVRDGELRPAIEFLTADGPSNIRVYAWDRQPGGANDGDLWIDVGQGNRLHRWGGFTWNVVADTDKRPLESLLLPVTSGLPVERVGLFRAFYQGTVPTAPLTNDVWVNGPTVSIYRNGGWRQDTNLAFFTSADVAPGGTADGLVRLYVQKTEPGDVGAKDTGDIWLNGASAFKWDGDSWEPATLPATTWGDALSPYTANRPVGTVSIVYAPDQPATGKYWLNTANGVLTERVNSAWVVVQDADLLEAVTRAGARQSIADGLVTLYSQDAPPASPTGVGDFWVDTANGSRMLVWDGREWGTTANVELSRQTASIETVLRHMRGTVSTDLEATMRYVARSAGGNSTIYTGSTPPNITGKEIGDLWWQVETTGTGESRIDSIIGQWVWKGDSTGWAKQKLRHEVISSVDVGSLVVGGQARIANAVIQKLYAEVVESKVIATKLLAVADFTNLHPDPFFENYAEEYEIDANWRIDPLNSRALLRIQPPGETKNAIWRASNWTRVVPGKQYLLALNVRHNGGGQTHIHVETRGTETQTTYQARIVAPNLLEWSTEYTVPTDGSVYWIRLATHSAPDASPYHVRVSSPTIRLMNAGELIVDGAITTRQLAAESVSTDKLAANAVTADKVDAGAVQARHLNVISTDPTTANKIVIDSRGMRLYDGADHLITEITNSATSVYRVLADNGDVVASINEDGTITGTEVSADQMYLEGAPLGGEGGLIDRRAGGVVPGSIGYRDLSGMTKDATDWGFMEIAVVLDPARSYRMVVEPFLIDASNFQTRYMNIRYTLDGSQPTLSSRTWKTIGGRATSGGYVQIGGSLFIRGSYFLGNATEPTLVRFLFCAVDPTGLSFPPGGQSEVTVWIEDMGIPTEPAGRWRDLYKDRTSGSIVSGNDATTRPPVYRTTTCSVSSFRSWQGNNSTYTWAGHTSVKMFQGNANYGGIGLLRSAALFSGTGAFRGKTITRARVRAKIANYAGAPVQVQVVGHGLTSLPSSKPSVTSLGTISGAPGQTIEFTIPKSHYSALSSGEIRGIGFGNGGTAIKGYASFPATSVKLIVTYED